MWRQPASAASSRPAGRWLRPSPLCKLATNCQQLKHVGKGHGVFHFDERIDEGGLTAAA